MGFFCNNANGLASFLITSRGGSIGYDNVVTLLVGGVEDEKCRNPTLAKCGGEAQHFQSWGLGVLRDSRMFRVRQQGPKHLALRFSWCH